MKPEILSPISILLILSSILQSRLSMSTQSNTAHFNRNQYVSELLSLPLPFRIFFFALCQFTLANPIAPSAQTCYTMCSMLDKIHTASSFLHQSIRQSKMSGHTLSTDNYIIILVRTRLSSVCRNSTVHTPSRHFLLGLNLKVAAVGCV